MADTGHTYSEAELLEKLAVDPNLFQNDMEQAVADVQRMSSTSSLGRALTLLSDYRFESFYHSKTSSMLLVNGNMQLTLVQEARSPLTYISGTLYNMLAKQPTVLRLFHLCDQGTVYTSHNGGLAYVLRCLNASLLSDKQRVAPLCFEEEFVQKLRSNDTKTLCTLLYMLVSTSTRPVVFILIDSIRKIEEDTPYERHFKIFNEELGAMINELNFNSRRNLRPTILKVLFMSPTRSTHLEPLLRDISVNLPGDYYGMEEYYANQYHTQSFDTYITY